MSTFSNFISYLKKPDDVPYSETNFLKKLKMVGIIFLWDKACSYGVSMIITIIFMAGGLQIFHDKAYPVAPNLYVISFYLFLLERVFIGPILEEIMFRLMVTKFNLVKVKISLSTLIAFILETVFHKNYLVKSPLFEKILDTQFGIYAVIIGMAIIFYLVLTCFNRTLTRLNSYWDKYFYIVFYGCAFLFCIAHYRSTPLLLLPVMFVTSILFGYTRVKLGLKYSISLHIASNATLSLSYFI